VNRRVTCINKTDRENPYERIENIGGAGWNRTQQQAIAYTYGVRLVINSVWVIVATHNGNKYIKTQNDGIEPNKLLACPNAVKTSVVDL
jgi:hypothetical protein